jgi:hypothetical protein
MSDLTHQARKFEECEVHLEEGLETLSRFFHQWHLCPNPSKTEVCVFHLGTHDANSKRTVQFDNTLITHVDHTSWDDSGPNAFLYKPHLEKTGMKVNSRVNLLLVRKSEHTLQTACIALIYSAAEYCAPVWLNSVHVN